MDAMGMGALLSLWLWQANPSTRQIKGKAVSILAAGLAAEIICHFLGLSHIMSKSFVALMFMAVVALSLAWEPLAKVLSIAPLRLTGKVSYCLYLAHPVVGALVYHEISGSSLAARAARSILIFVLSYAVAFLSWTFFESPILSLKKYFTSYGPPKHHSSSDDLGSASWNALPGVD
jgi:peptidoglycan/LPS O-acetylase OafA/YrhL